MTTRRSREAIVAEVARLREHVAAAREPVDVAFAQGAVAALRWAQSGQRSASDWLAPASEVPPADRGLMLREAHARALVRAR